MSGEEYKIVLADAKNKTDAIAQDLKELLSMYDAGLIDVGFLTGGVSSYSKQLSAVCTDVQSAGDRYYNRT